MNSINYLVIFLAVNLNITIIRNHEHLSRVASQSQRPLERVLTKASDKAMLVLSFVGCESYLVGFVAQGGLVLWSNQHTCAAHEVIHTLVQLWD